MPRIRCRRHTKTRAVGSPFPERPANGRGEPATTATFDALLRELVDEKTYPRLHRIAWTQPDGEGVDGGGPPSEREEFLFGIDLILDGIQAYMDRDQAGPTG